MFKCGLAALAAVKNWVWSTTRKNWPVVKEKNAWAVNSAQKKRSVAKGDKIIFYVKGTNYFQGVFEATSDWHEPTVEWLDAPPGSAFEHEIDLKPVQLGHAALNKISDKLEFIENKKRVGVYLRGSAHGPANLGRPVSDDDLRVILGELAATREKPTARTPRDRAAGRAFVPVDSWGFIKERIHHLPSPERKSISLIIEDIENGKVAIPVFQRGYAWKRTQIEELWESIFQGFFVGSILTWDARGELYTSQVHGAPSPQDGADVVLDGQQRMTSLYYAVAVPDVPLLDSRMRFFVDLRALLDPDADSSDIVFAEPVKESKEPAYAGEESQFANKVFPLAMLGNHTSWLYRFKEYLKEKEGLDGEQAERYFSQISDIVEHVWFRYEIPIVQLPGSLPLDRVASIFERINSKGTRLGVFDLLNSRFMKSGVELRTNWKRTKAEFDNIRRMSEELDNTEKYMLQGMGLFRKGSCRRKELLALDRAYTRGGKFQTDEFERDWSGISRHMSKVIGQLESREQRGFGATRFSMIPYTVLIPILSSLVYKIEGRDDRPRCMDKIRTWYWSAVTSDNYSGSSDTKLEKDHRELQRWFDDDGAVPGIVSEQRGGVGSLDVNTSKTNYSVYRAAMCLISKSGALDFASDEGPEPGASEDCHIFPKSGKRYGGDVTADSVLNRTVLSVETRRGFLADRMPSEYLKKIMDEQGIGEREILERLKTHLISDEAFGCLLKDDFVGFVAARRKTILEALKGLILPADDRTKTEIDHLLRCKESQKLEYKSSLRWNVKGNRQDATLEEVIAKELCCFMNADGGDLLIGVDDDGEPVGLEKDYSTFKDGDADVFAQHVTNLVNNHLGKLANRCVEMKFVKVCSAEVCWCAVKPSPEPVFFRKDGDKTLFRRANNTCQRLDAEEAHRYILQHWPGRG